MPSNGRRVSKKSLIATEQHRPTRYFCSILSMHFFDDNIEILPKEGTMLLRDVGVQ
jgi:hypothetical protein